MKNKLISYLMIVVLTMSNLGYVTASESDMTDTLYVEEHGDGEEEQSIDDAIIEEELTGNDMSMEGVSVDEDDELVIVPLIDEESESDEEVIFDSVEEAYEYVDLSDKVFYAALALAENDQEYDDIIDRMIYKTSSTAYSSSYGEQLEPEARYIYEQMKLNWQGIDPDDCKIEAALRTPIKIKMDLVGKVEDEWQWKMEFEEAEQQAKDKIYEYVCCAYVALMLDCPEIYWLGSGFHYKAEEWVPPMLDNSGDWSADDSHANDYYMFYAVTIKPDEVYSGAAAKYGAYTEALKSACSSIKGKLAAQPDTAYARVKTIHDYILNAGIKTDNTYNVNNYISKYTSAGFFFEKSLACEGYAKTFKLFCDLFAIPCVVVKGNAENPSRKGPHAWNLVQLNDTWYLCDLMWDAADDQFNILDASMLDKLKGQYSWMPEGGTVKQLKQVYTGLNLTYTFNIPSAGTKGFHIWKVDVAPTHTQDGRKSCEVHANETAVIPRLSNCSDYEYHVIKKATPTENGKSALRCKVNGCHKIKNGTETTITKVSNSGLKKNTFVYNGKVQKPSIKDIVVRDSNNNVIPSAYYRIEYQNANSMAVGEYVITIRFINNPYYDESKPIRLSYQIRPTAPSKPSCKWVGKKKIKISWKLPKGVMVSGYEIQYASDKKFKNMKSIIVNKGTAKSTQIKNLPKKKKYYARVRAFSVVNGKTLYSGWAK